MFHWYVVKCVSQKWNWSNNNNQWYNIIVTFRLKYVYSVISVIDKRLPGNTQKWTLVRSWLIGVRLVHSWAEWLMRWEMTMSYARRKSSLCHSLWGVYRRRCIWLMHIHRVYSVYDAFIHTYMKEEWVTSIAYASNAHDSYTIYSVYDSFIHTYMKEEWVASIAYASTTHDSYCTTRIQYPPAPINHVKIFKGWPLQDALSKLVQLWYKSFLPGRFLPGGNEEAEYVE